MKAKAKDKILQAALKEFAAKGYAGARIGAIARRAGINKAMVFYYYTCKRDLYKLILQHALSRLFTEISGLFNRQLTAEAFVENMPRIYIGFIARHPDLVRIIGIDLLQNPGNITSALHEIAHSDGSGVPKSMLWAKIREWHRQGKLSEEDPVQVMMNIISLSIFPFLGLPMIESISGEKIRQDQAFYEKRIQSVVNVLKRGLTT